MTVTEPAEAPVITPAGRLAARSSASNPVASKDWCPIEGALERVGTRSAVILLREVFYGARRFDDLARLTGLTDAVAAKRLKRLVADGLLAQRPYREAGARTRYEYVLTGRSQELFALLVALAEWGRRVDADRDGVEFVHAGCGAPLQAAVRCADGHDVAPGEAEARLASDASGA